MKKSMMGKLQKVFILGLCLILVFGLGACDRNQDDGSQSDNQQDNNGDGDIMSGKCINLIDPAWAAEVTPPGADMYVDLEKLTHVGDKVQDISMDLFKASMTAGENGMMSPVSLLMAMAMVENGAGGASLEQMEEAFGCSMQELSGWLKAWSDSLKTSEDTSMNVANSFWFRDSQALTVKEDYLKDISFYLDAQAYKAPFDGDTVSEMNKWCDDNTFGMIKDIVNSLNPQDMTVILNATAFEGVWKEAYEDFQVQEDEVFTREDGAEEKATLLYSREFMYIEGENVTGFKKPYKDGYSFVALLPDEGVSVADFIKGLDGKTFRSLVENVRYETVDAVIPEFTSRYTITNLANSLADMGITDIFSPQAADLSGMAQVSGENLFVSDILQKTFIEVNRKGTRAAAVTEIKCGASAAMQEKVYNVRLDRPFVYAIVDDGTNTPLFIGTTMSVA